MYVYMRAGNFGKFNLAVVILTAKLPNLIPRQIFRLYSLGRAILCTSFLSLLLGKHHPSSDNDLCDVQQRVGVVTELYLHMYVTHAVNIIYNIVHVCMLCTWVHHVHVDLSIKSKISKK